MATTRRGGLPLPRLSRQALPRGGRRQNAGGGPALPRAEASAAASSGRDRALAASQPRPRLTLRRGPVAAGGGRQCRGRQGSSLRWQCRGRLTTPDLLPQSPSHDASPIQRGRSSTGLCGPSSACAQRGKEKLLSKAAAFRLRPRRRALGRRGAAPREQGAGGGKGGRSDMATPAEPPSAGGEKPAAAPPLPTAGLEEDDEFEEFDTEGARRPSAAGAGGRVESAGSKASFASPPPLGPHAGDRGAAVAHPPGVQGPIVLLRIPRSPSAKGGTRTRPLAAMRGREKQRPTSFRRCRRPRAQSRHAFATRTNFFPSDPSPLAPPRAQSGRPRTRSRLTRSCGRTSGTTTTWATTSPRSCGPSSKSRGSFPSPRLLDRSGCSMDVRAGSRIQALWTVAVRVCARVYVYACVHARSFMLASF